MALILDLRLIFLRVAFAFLLPACTFKGLLYDNLDRVTLYQIDGYLDLNASQKKSIEGPIREQVAWLKSQKLPEAIEGLRELESAAAAHRWDEALSQAIDLRLEKWRQELAERLLPTSAELLASLDDTQIAHLEKKLSEGTKELSELVSADPKDFDEDRDDYLEDRMKRYKKWYGSYSKEQKELAKTLLEYDRPHLAEELRQRLRARAGFLDELRKHDRPQLLSFLKRWSLANGVWLDESYAQYLQDTRKRWKKFGLAFHQSLSDAQWEKLQEHILETRKDLQALQGRQK